MLYGNMKEPKPNSIIPIDTDDPKAFQSVIDYAHCKDPMINSNNVASIKQIADKYQLIIY